MHIMSEQQQHQQQQLEEDEPIMTYPNLEINTDIHDDDLFDAHPSVSPETPAESFFISPELRTNNVSAFALASELHRSASKSGRRSGASTLATDDFQSAHDHEGDIDESAAAARANITPFPIVYDSLFGKDILVLSRSSIPEDDDNDTLQEDEEDTFQDTIMSSPIETTTTTDDHVNAAQVVYEKVKDVWTWGKGLPVVGFFEGITEAVANKVVSVAGTSLEEIDGQIKPVVAGIDTSYLNPAIEAIVKAIMNGVGKADETFRPVIEAVVPTVLGPLGLLESDKKKDELKASDTPELTTTPVAGSSH